MFFAQIAASIFNDKNFDVDVISTSLVIVSANTHGKPLACASIPVTGKRYIYYQCSSSKQNKQGLENEIVEQKQEKSTKEKEFALIQEELQQKKQTVGSTEVRLTADNLQQYVKKIEVDRRKITCTEFVF